MPERIGLRKLFAKLGCCRILCSYLRDKVVNCSQCSLTMLLSRLTSGVAKPLTCSEEVLPMGSIQPPTVDRLALPSSVP
jgi:hypothetical protein